MKVCRSCKKSKPLSEYYKEKGGKNGLRSACKECRSNDLKKWNDKIRNNPELRVKYRESARLKKIERVFGIAASDFNRMFEEQKGCCAICNKHQSELKKSLAVDHCHRTGKVRSLLCGNCNTTLGLVGENLVVLQTMIEYLSPRNNG